MTDQQRFLLGECVQAYLPLDEAQQREFERLKTSAPYEGVLAMNKTWFEQGMEKGEAKGEAKGEEKGRRSFSVKCWKTALARCQPRPWPSWSRSQWIVCDCCGKAYKMLNRSANWVSKIDAARAR